MFRGLCLQISTTSEIPTFRDCVNARKVVILHPNSKNETTDRDTYVYGFCVGSMG